MPSMRPGTKVRLWSPKFSSHPDVEPPALLKFVGALSVFSAVGVLIYAVAKTLAMGGASEPVGIDAIYVAVLHFVMPIGVFYTINVNSPLSRHIVGIYSITLFLATITGRGLLGNLPVDETTKLVASTTILVSVIYWLFGSPKMRFYYATIANRPIPEDLEHREEDLRGGVRLNPKARVALEWVIDRLETAVLLGFIVVVFYAWWSTG